MIYTCVCMYLRIRVYIYFWATYILNVVLKFIGTPFPRVRCVKIACLIQCAHSPRARTECALVILDLVLWIDLHEMIILYNSNIYHRFIDIDRID